MKVSRGMAGIVIICTDPRAPISIEIDDTCVGCKLCTIACPYGTMFYDPDTRKAFKCNLCGGAPACAEACPTAAITYEATATADWLGEFARERTARVLAGAR